MNITYKQLEKELKEYEELIKDTWKMANENGDDFGQVIENDKKLIMLNNALDEIMYDRYYEIIELYYLKDKTYAYIENNQHFGHATISKQKARLVNQMLTYINNN